MIIHIIRQGIIETNSRFIYSNQYISASDTPASYPNHTFNFEDQTNTDHDEKESGDDTPKQIEQVDGETQHQMVSLHTSIDIKDVSRI